MTAAEGAADEDKRRAVMKPLQDAEWTAATLIYEHDIPDGLGGEPTLENCKVHCRICADIKTDG